MVSKDTMQISKRLLKFAAMQSLICKNPFELSYESVPEPLLVEQHSLIKVKRIGICGTDIHAYEGTQPYFTYPRTLGHELSGEIVQTAAEGFSVGERVTIIPYFNCDNCLACRSGKPNCCSNLKVFGVHIDGGMQELVLVPDSKLVKSNGLSYDELALVEPLAIGAHGVKRAGITRDEFVLIIGAGPIGIGTMEFARIAGGKVIAMDINEDRLNFCRKELGVEYTVNPLITEARATIQAMTNNEMPSIVIDATGSLQAINSAFSLMGHGARYVLIGLQRGDIIVNHPEFHKREGTLMSSRNATREDFDQVISSMTQKLINPSTYITHRVGFSEIKSNFDSWLLPENKVIKAMVEL